MKAERITRVSPEEARNMTGQTDWARIDAEIAAGIPPAADPDADFEIDWASARVVVPQVKRAVSLRLDADVLDFFRDQGKGYQTRINAVLRAYMEATEKPARR